MWIGLLSIREKFPVQDTFILAHLLHNWKTTTCSLLKLFNKTASTTLPWQYRTHRRLRKSPVKSSWLLRLQNKLPFHAARWSPFRLHSFRWRKSKRRRLIEKSPWSNYAGKWKFYIFYGVLLSGKVERWSVIIEWGLGALEDW